MRIEFLKPSYLFLIPVVFSIIIFISYKGNLFKRFSSFKKHFLTFIRLMVCSLLIMAMATPRININSNIVTTVILVDKSASIDNGNNQDEISEFLKSITEIQGEKDEIGVIAFGENVSVEQMPTLDKNTFYINNLKSVIDYENTNIDSALTVANSIFETGKGKRVVLISDGIETIGNSTIKAQMLHENGVDLKIFPINSNITNEVQMTNLTIPNTIPKNIEFNIEMEIDSTVSTSGNIRLYKNNTFMKEEKIQIEKGKNRIVFTDYSDVGGAVFYKGEIIPDIDSISENNIAYGYTFIEDIPKILVIGNENNGVSTWENIIKNSNLQVDITGTATAPTTISELQNYESIIMSNVDADDLPIGFLNSLESYVGVTGGGLIVSGGNKSFGLGNYGDTILEDILPINMEVKTQGEESNFAMIMIIDRSGSMMSGEYGISPINMAKEAVIGSLSGFKEKDIVGVIGFDSEYRWIVPTTEVIGNESFIINKIKDMTADGGTSILPALNEGVNTLINVDAKEKHVILLTDGMAETDGYNSVLDKMNDNGITLSTVAVGSESDRKLLEKLAVDGNGRYYYTDAFGDLPKIFAKETTLASKEHINEESFYPLQSNDSLILNGINSIPPLNGYVSSTNKFRSDLILVSDKEEPILATWQYGLGRTAVWTSDIGGSWSSDFISSNSGLNILQNTLGYVLNTNITSDINVTGEIINNENSVVTLEIPEYNENIQSIKANILYDNGTNIETKLNMATPTTYETYIPISKEGVYVISFEFLMKNGEIENYNSGFLLPYSKEFDINYRESIFNNLIAFGGEFVETGEEVFDDSIVDISTKKDVTNEFLWLALFIFLIDIALRRFTFILNKLEKNIEIKKGNKKDRKKEDIKENKSEDKKENKQENKSKNTEEYRNNKKDNKEIKEKQKVENSKPTQENSTAEKLASLKKKRDDK